jgi:ribosomal protein S18 acetylase RimI-like enzyme
MMSRVRDDLVIADSGLPCDTFNFVCRARLEEAAARAAALEAVTHFANVGRPFSWWVGPADRPRTLDAVLEDIGLERAETALAMALALPAATAEATVQAGTVGLYNISTRAQFRGRGIGSVLTWQPLPDARVAGCETAVLQAAAEGVGIYRRLGFTPFGEITEFKPSRT